MITEVTETLTGYDASFFRTVVLPAVLAAALACAFYAHFKRGVAVLLVGVVLVAIVPMGITALAKERQTDTISYLRVSGAEITSVESVGYEQGDKRPISAMVVIAGYPNTVLTFRSRALLDAVVEDGHKRIPTLYCEEEDPMYLVCYPEGEKEAVTDSRLRGKVALTFKENKLWKERR